MTTMNTSRSAEWRRQNAARAGAAGHTADSYIRRLVALGADELSAQNLADLRVLVAVPEASEAYREGLAMGVALTIEAVAAYLAELPKVVK